MATSANFDNIVTPTAPAGGVTAGTMLLYDSTNKLVGLPMTTAASGVTFALKVFGRVNGVTKSTATAWVIGDRLASNSVCVFSVAASTAASTIDRACGFAASTQAAGDATGDIVLTGGAVGQGT